MTKSLTDNGTELVLNADPKLQPGQPDITKTKNPLDDEDEDFDESLDDLDYDHIDYDDEDDF